MDLPELPAIDADALQQARIDLAAALRAAAWLGLNEGVDNHFTARVPGTTDRYLINPKLHWSQITAGDVLIVDRSGRVVDGSRRPPMTGPNIHIPVHEAHPRGGCVFHVHAPWMTALTVTRGGRLEMCHQNALRFFGDVAYDDDFNGFATAQEEGRRMAAAIGDKTILFLANHGVLCVTETIAEGIDNLYYLERSCQLQILGASTGKKLLVIEDAVARDAHQVLRGLMRGNAIAHFEQLKAILARQEPHFAG